MYITKNYTGIRSTVELIQISLPFFFLAIFFAVLKYRQLTFKEFEIEYTEEEFQEAVTRTINEFNWKIKNNRKNFFCAIRPFDWSGSWGEMITIEKKKNRILITSVCRSL